MKIALLILLIRWYRQNLNCSNFAFESQFISVDEILFVVAKILKFLCQIFSTPFLSIDNYWLNDFEK
jgi:hypothetical protein